MATIDQQFVEYIIKSLAAFPDDVKVERTIDERGVLLTLTVNAEDLGRIIGRRGSTAQSIRTLLRALGTKHEAHYNLRIVNNDRPVDEQAAAASGEDETKIDETVENLSEITKNTREELEKLDDLDI